MNLSASSIVCAANSERHRYTLAVSGVSSPEASIDMASSKGTNKPDNKVQGSGGDQGGSKQGQGKKAEGRKSSGNQSGKK